MLQKTSALIAILSCLLLSCAAQTILPEGRYKIRVKDYPTLCFHVFGSVPLKTDKVRIHPCLNSALQNFNIIKVGNYYRVARDGLTKYGISSPSIGIEQRVTEYDASNPNKSLWIINEKSSTSSNPTLSIEAREFEVKNLESQDCFDLASNFNAPGQRIIDWVCHGSNAQTIKFIPIV